MPKPAQADTSRRSRNCSRNKFFIILPVGPTGSASTKLLGNVRDFAKPDYHLAAQAADR
jgi:hypothetical protein